MNPFSPIDHLLVGSLGRPGLVHRMGMKRGGLRIPIGVKRPAHSMHTVGKKAVRLSDVGLRKATNNFQKATPIALVGGTAAGIGPTAAGVTALGAATTGLLRAGMTKPLRRALGD